MQANLRERARSVLWIIVPEIGLPIKTSFWICVGVSGAIFGLQGLRRSRDSGLGLRKDMKEHWYVNMSNMSVVLGCVVKKHLETVSRTTYLKSLSSDHPVKHLAAGWSSPLESLPNTFNAKHHVSSCSLINLSLWLCISRVCVCVYVRVHVHTITGVLAASLAKFFAFQWPSMKCKQTVSANCPEHVLCLKHKFSPNFVIRLSPLEKPQVLTSLQTCDEYLDYGQGVVFLKGALHWDHKEGFKGFGCSPDRCTRSPDCILKCPHTVSVLCAEHAASVSGFFALQIGVFFANAGFGTAEGAPKWNSNQTVLLSAQPIKAS